MPTIAMREKRAPSPRRSPRRSDKARVHDDRNPLEGERPAEGGVNRRSDRQRRLALALPSVAKRKLAPAPSECWIVAIAIAPLAMLPPTKAIAGRPVVPTLERRRCICPSDRSLDRSDSSP
jgi:hypothetical protein